MKKTVIFSVIILAAVMPIVAQPAKPKEKVKPEAPQKVLVTPYGFVRNYFNFDSRRTMTVCGGEYNMIPYDEDWNMTEAQAALYGSDERFDRNAVPEAHLLALSTRFGFRLEGPQLLGAQASGVVEADFAGFGNTNTVLRLRLAYMALDWTSERYTHRLVIGQDWHPLSGSIMPEVLGMAAGAPFRPHSRTPQVSYTCWLPWRFGVTASALWQYQFTSPGPDGESAAYANRSLVPELFMGVNYKTENVYAQIGVDYINLDIRREIPVLDALGTELYKRLSDKRCQSFSPTLYFQYSTGKFALKLRSTIAENLGHLNMLSGYAMVAELGDPSAFCYKPVRSSVSYVNFAYGNIWRANLFLGYQKNLGLAGDYNILDFALTGANNLYMKKGVDNINSFYRVAPSLSFNTKAFNIGLEYEWTAVTYGDLQSDATVANNDNLRVVSNHRICALVKYNF